MQKIIFLITLLLVTFQLQHVCAAVVTEEVLTSLKVKEVERGQFLKNESSKWAKACISESIVYYKTGDDFVIGYEKGSGRWMRFFAPASTALPLESMVIYLSKEGSSTYGIGKLSTCSEKTLLAEKSESEAIEEKKRPVTKPEKKSGEEESEKVPEKKQEPATPTKKPERTETALAVAEKPVAGISKDGFESVWAFLETYHSTLQ